MPALVDSVPRLAVIATTIGTYWRRDRIATLLFVPCFGRIAFAAALDASIGWLSR